MTNPTSTTVRTDGRRAVVLVDVHPLALAWLRERLRAVEEVRITAAVGSGRQGLRTVRHERPDLVVLGIPLTDIGEDELCAQIRASSPSTKILVFTASDDPVVLGPCVESGAESVLLRRQDIVSTIRRMLGIEPIARNRRARTNEPAAEIAKPKLTNRENEVLRLMAEGLTSRAIAASLHLSPNTVRSYVQSILAKLGVRNRIQAIQRARDLNVL